MALLNARAPQAQREGAVPWLGAVALDSAVMNVPAAMRARHLRLYDDAFGSDPAHWAALSPFHQWTVGAPPLQMVCSTQRADQPCTQAEAMARHVRSQGGRAEVLPQALSHGEINARLGLDSDYTRAVETFMGSLDAEAARALPAIADAVKGQIKILADSGIRNGLDVVRALALGADCAMIGRAYIYALAAAGEAGVKHLLELLEKEMRVAMTLTSVAKVADISADLLAREA